MPRTKWKGDRVELPAELQVLKNWDMANLRSPSGAIGFKPFYVHCFKTSSGVGNLR